VNRRIRKRRRKRDEEEEEKKETATVQMWKDMLTREEFLIIKGIIVYRW